MRERVCESVLCVASRYGMLTSISHAMTCFGCVGWACREESYCTAGVFAGIGLEGCAVA